MRTIMALSRHVPEGNGSYQNDNKSYYGRSVIQNGGLRITGHVFQTSQIRQHLYFLMLSSKLTNSMSALS